MKGKNIGNGKSDAFYPHSQLIFFPNTRAHRLIKQELRALCLGMKKNRKNWKRGLLFILTASYLFFPEYLEAHSSIKPRC